MSYNDTIRLELALFIGVGLPVLIYCFAHSKKLRRAERNSCAESNDSLRTEHNDPGLSSLVLMIVLGVAVAIGLMLNRTRRLMPLMISLALEIAAYFTLLLLLLPLLRKAFRPSTVAALWLLPNTLALVLYLRLPPSEPTAVLLIPADFTWWPFIVWGLGFLAIMTIAICRHLTFRKKLLRDTKPVTDPATLTVWQEELHALGLDSGRRGIKTVRSTHVSVARANLMTDLVSLNRSEGQSIPEEARGVMHGEDFEPSLPLVISPATATPLSIGILASTTLVVLPQQSYTPDELRLILRHELLHVKGGDAATKLFLTFCQALCWFNPLMWIAMRKCADDLELGCDELVLTGANDATREQYARLVLRTAGDERGFTTCLSVRARALRYRLRSIVSQRRKLAGGLLICLLTAALLLGHGMVAVAYAPARGEDVIFAGDSTDYTPTLISDTPCHGNYVGTQYTCTDIPALKNYLSQLTLYRIPDYQPDSRCISISMNNHFAHIALYEHMVFVSTYSRSDWYYSPEPLDLDYLVSLMVEKDRL